MLKRCAALALLLFAAVAGAVVPTTTSVVDYTCNGTSKVFSIPYRFLDQAHLRVSRMLVASPFTETLLTLSSDYTVSGAGVATGGTLVLAAPGTSCASSSYKLRIRRITPRVQGTAFSTSGSFNPKAHEAAFDRQTMIAQELNDGAFVAATNFDFTGPSASAGLVTALGSSVARRLDVRLGETVNVKDFGALGDGSTDDTAAIKSAVDAAGATTVVYFPAGTYKVSTRVDLPMFTGTHVRGGAGATLNCAGTACFYRGVNAGSQGRGNLFRMEGLTFTGTAPAFYFDAADSLPYQTMDHEYSISRCRFLQSSGWALYFHGAREGSITESHFELNQGIFADYTINMDVVACTFKDTANGVFYSTASEGLKVLGGSMLGTGYGVRTSGNVGGVQILGAMIDFCDQPVYLDAVTAVLISGSYITSRNHAGLSKPAINIVHTAGNPTDHIRIVNNVLMQRGNLGFDGAVMAYNCDDVEISGNTIGYWWDGIIHHNATNLTISRNNIWRMPSATGSYSIDVGTGAASVRIHDNKVDLRINGSGTEYVKGNVGAAAGDSWIAEAATAGVAFRLNNSTSMATGKLLSLANAGTEKFAVDVGGVLTAASNVQLAGAAPTVAATGTDQPLLLQSNDANDASAVGVAVNNNVSLTTDGGKLLVLRNAGTDKAWVNAMGGIVPGAPTAAWTTSAIYMGSGAPNNSFGGNGSVYLRTDTPGTSNQRLYVKNAGTWTGIL